MSDEIQARMLTSRRGIVESIDSGILMRFEGSSGSFTIRYDQIDDGVILVDGVPYYTSTNQKVQVGDYIIAYALLRENQLYPHYVVEPDVDKITQEAIFDTVSQDLDAQIEPIDVPEDDITMQIGSVRLLVPTTFVRVERVASTNYIPVLRSRGSIKKSSGHADTRISMQIIFPDEASINDPQNGLRALIAMFRRTPFVPIYNRHLNLNEDIWAVCLYDLQVSTIAGFPRSLMVELVLLEFDWSIYLLDYSDFGSAINWTLFDWYVRRGLLDQNGELKPAKFDGPDIAFEYIPMEELEAVSSLIEVAQKSQTRADVAGIASNYEKAKDYVEKVHRRTGDILRSYEQYPERWLMSTAVVNSTFESSYDAFKDMLVDHMLSTGETGITLNMETGQLTPASQRLLDRMERHVEYLRNQLNEARKAYNERALFQGATELDASPWPLNGTCIVTAAQTGIQNYFARLPIQSQTKPSYQFLGSTDHRIQFGMIVDEEGLQSLQELFAYCQESARKYYSKISSGFLRIQNPITDLFGIEWVLIEAMVSQSMPGYPGHYQVELTLIDYNQFQTARMRGVFLTKSQDDYIIKLQEGQDLPGTVVFGLENQEEWIKAEKVFPLIDCYPDLDLPTWDEVAEFLSERTGRTIHAEDINVNGGYFVDPDFYFFPPVVTDQEITEMTKGEEAVVVSVESQLRDLDRRRLWQEVLRITSGAGSSPGINAKIDHVRTGDAKLGDLFTSPEGEPKVEYADNEPEEGDTLDVPRSQGREGLFERAFHDYLKYNYRGRMVRAFPTFHMFAIDEGGWVRHQRLWDNFYGFNAVSSIDTHHSRLMATGTCMIELANVDNFIRSGRETYHKPKERAFRLDWSSLLPLAITPEMIRKRQALPDYIILKPGARLHLRLGYGNNLADLPVVFNGTVTDVKYGEVVTLVAQTDGRELVEPLFFNERQVSSSPIFGGHYPRAFLLRLLLYGASGFWGRIAQRVRYAIWPESINGVIHFGNPEHTLFRRKEGELGQNIYYGKEGSVSASDSPWALFTGEFRVPMMLYSKSIWDIGEILAAAVPNFVFAVRPFEMRSTIFYGKPWWDWAYGYEVVPGPELENPEESQRLINAVKNLDPAIQVLEREYQRGNLSEEDFRKSVQSTINSITIHTRSSEEVRKAADLIAQGYRPGPGYWVKEAKKTFSQWHIYTSADAIIQNDIRLVLEGVYNNVTGLYLEHGNEEQSILVRADPDIYPQFQRGKVVHTELHAQGGWFPILGDIQAWIYGSFARTVAMNIAGAVLRDSMKDMYQGSLTVIGDPTVWPYDTIYLADLHKDMTGTCFVKEVHHRFSLDTGFVTAISPDLACAIKDKEIYDWLGLGSMGLGIAFYGLFRSRINQFFRGALVKTNQGIIRPLLNLGRVQGALSSGANALRNAGQVARNIMNAMRGVRVLGSAVNVGIRGGLWASRAAAVVGGAIAGFSSLASFLIFTPFAFLGAAMIQEGFRRMEISDRMLVCNFLSYKGGEFSIGMDGASQLTVTMPELATNVTLIDMLRDVLPGFVSYRELSATHLMDEFGSLFSDQALQALLTQNKELTDRLQNLSPAEISIFNNARKSDSVVLLSALNHLGIPYRRNGRDSSGLDAKGLMESTLSLARIGYESSNRLIDFVTSDQFVEVREAYQRLKVGDIILLDRNPDDGPSEYDQAVFVIDPVDGWGVAVLERDLPQHGLGAGVRIINYKELYPKVSRRIFRHVGMSP